MQKTNNPEIRKAFEEEPNEALIATSELINSQSACKSRRSLLRGAMNGAAGLVVAGTAASALTTADVLHSSAVHAEVTSGGATLKEFFSILATGEELSATLYRLGVANHSALGITGAQLIALEAILAEEELHVCVAKALGGVPATNQFSFPHGADTFNDRLLFLQAQQLIEELTNGALLAWIKDLATMGMPRLAQIGGQLIQSEGGHRVVGRVMLEANPYDNWAFGPVVVDHFTQVPSVVAAAGFLSPKSGNNFSYQPTSPSFPGVINTRP
jgi:hypothetical protein